MKPDEKYMSEVKIKNNFKFVPPSFNRSLMMDDGEKNDIVEQKESLDLYPDETNEDQLYCYYNSLENCSNESKKVPNSQRNPETFDVLRGLDLDIDEISDLDDNYRQNNINKIYMNIMNRNPGINESLSLYGVPSPIVKVITKRIIKLSLLYKDKE